MLAPKARTWLTEADGVEIRRLMDWLSRPMHPRVHRAYYNHEYALRLYELDIRWPLIVGGFEALVNTEPDNTAWQFRDRVIRLAAELNIPLTDDELWRAYRLRSKLVHAESFLHSLGGEVAVVNQPILYQTLESLLRATVKRCLLDSSFNDYFLDENSVRKQWPLRPNPTSKAKGKSPRKVRVP